MPLSEEQRAAIDSLDWLLDEHPRRIGRSYAMAVALIRAALARPGRSLAYLDHLASGRHMHDTHMRSRIEGIITADPLLAILPWRFESAAFSVHNIEPIRDWWPEGARPVIPRPTIWEHLGRED